MTNTFTSDPTFSNYWTPSDAAVGSFATTGGLGGQVFMVGLDGNAYFPFFGGSADPNPEHAIACVQTGNVILITAGRFDTDAPFPYHSARNLFPCPGTPYFWVLHMNSIGGEGKFFRYSMVMYKIIDDATILAVATMSYETPTFAAEFGTEGKCITCDIDPITGRLFVLLQASGPTVGDPFLWVYSTFATDPTDPVLWSGWTVSRLLDKDFFNWAMLPPNTHRNLKNVARLAFDEVNEKNYLLIWLDKSGADYIAAHPSESPNWGLLTTPGVYRYDFSPFPGIYTLPSKLLEVTASDEHVIRLDIFDAITDIGTHLNGSTSTDARDDYYGLFWFQFGGRSYVAFNRSYTTEADLGTAGTGTYVHTTIFDYDGEVLTNIFDSKNSLFDTVVDTGATSGNRNKYPPNFVNLARYEDDLFYIFGNSTLGSGQKYVVGRAVTMVHTEPPGYNIYFSAFNNDNYVDWNTTVHITYESHLDTYWMLNPDQGLWAQAPYVISYVETDERASIFLSPRWEWTNNVSTHKQGPEEQVYVVRPLSGVSDKKTRVRGKGRALQLHWGSEDGMPFNLLGWSIDLESNSGD